MYLHIEFKKLLQKAVDLDSLPFSVRSWKTVGDCPHWSPW